MVFVFSRIKCDMHQGAEGFANLFADVLSYAYDVAGSAHFHDLAVVVDTVEGGVNQQAAFAEESFDVERHLHIGGIHILALQDYRIEFQHTYSIASMSCSKSFGSVVGA